MSSLRRDRTTHFPAAELTNPTGQLDQVELSGEGPPLFIDHGFDVLELRLCDDEATPGFEIVSALDWPQVHSRYVITQPEILAEDVRRGWAAIGGVYPDFALVGPSSTPGFEFSPSCGMDPQFYLRRHETYLALTACRGTAVSARLNPVDRVLAADLYEEAT
jgi:hypothetical protein